MHIIGKKYQISLFSEVVTFFSYFQNFGHSGNRLLGFLRFGKSNLGHWFQDFDFQDFIIRDFDLQEFGFRGIEFIQQPSQFSTQKNQNGFLVTEVYL